MNTCFEWPFSLNRHNGYGLVYSQGRQWRVHRLSYTMTNGPIPDGLVVMHKCHNPSCVNPDHLQVGTQKENMEMSVRDGRLTGAIKHSQVLINRCIKLRNEGMMLKDVSAITGIPISTISNYCRGYTKINNHHRKPG